MGVNRISDHERRAAQWDAFHEWESSDGVSAMSLEERVAWYREAFRFALTHSPEADAGAELQDKVRTIRQIRARLTRMPPCPRNA